MVELNPKIRAPFTDEQVAALNRYQTETTFHEFTCGNEHTGERTLVAATDGWICPSCAYTQKWAHQFMLQKPQDPFAVWKEGKANV